MSSPRKNRPFGEFDESEIEAPPVKKRRGGKRRTKTSVIPEIPCNEEGVKANPTSTDEPIATVEEVEGLKFSDCRYYDGCLTHAAKSGWEQFHCKNCKIYEWNPDIDEEFAELLTKLVRHEPV